MENTVTSSNLYLANHKRMNEWTNERTKEYRKAEYKLNTFQILFKQLNIDDA